MEHAQPEHKGWKSSFYIFSAMLLIIMPLVSYQYGQSGDEWLQIEYGQHIWEYFFAGNNQALDYSNRSLQYQGIEFYGGLFDFAMELLHRMLPSIPLLTLRHFFNALMGATMMIFTGLFAWRMGGRRWQVALIALLFIAFSPRIFGESMNNPKDIPFGCGFTIAMYSFLALLQDLPRKIVRHAIGVLIGFGIAFGVRPAGGLLLVAYFAAAGGLYYFFNSDFRNALKADNNKLLKKSILWMVLALAGGYVIGLLAWPWGLQAPLSRPLESLQAMTNIQITLRVLFEGRYRPNNAMPWYYELKWICISNPLIVLIGVALFIILMREGVKRYGWFAVLMLLFGAFFPPLYMIYKKSSVHDTWRHLFFIYPYWVCMAALGLPLIGSFVRSQHMRWMPFAVALLGLTPAIAWTVREHPNQYVYFNELEGGIQGAYGYYDTDYYQNSARQQAEWIRKNVKRIPGRKVVVLSNMLGFDKYFARDTSWLAWDYQRYNDRHQREWDYYVAYSRFLSPEQLQNGKWPPGNVVNTVEAGGVPLSVTIKRASNHSVEAHKALKANNFPQAAQLYAAYLKQDATDENVWADYAIATGSMGQFDAAIQALNQAIAIDPARVEFYQILASIYQAKGDMQGAQQATNNANAIIMREQELAD